MRIDQVLQKHKGTLSFEIFPPKGEFNKESVKLLLDNLCPLMPDYISVTYSAGGGGNSKLTEEIAAMAQRDYKIPSVSHITCINSTKSELEQTINSFASAGIENILALRGDKAEGCTATDYKHATEIIPSLINKGFCVGAACYPEGHATCSSLEEDVRYVKIKEDMGASFFVSQLCFQNETFFRFLDATEKIGVKSPICAGVMPIMSKSQINRMIFMCAVSLPSAVIRILNKYENDPASLLEAGLDYAALQVAELIRNGVDDVHFYTMNRPDVAKGLVERLAAYGVK